MINYGFFVNNSLLVVKYGENVQKREIVAFNRFIMQKANPSLLEMMVSDFRGVELDFSGAELEDLVCERTSIFTTSGKNVKETVLADSPSLTAMAILLSEALHGKGSVTVCSTIECCARQLIGSLSPSLFFWMFNNLNSTFLLT